MRPTRGRTLNAEGLSPAWASLAQALATTVVLPLEPVARKDPQWLKDIVAAHPYIAPLIPTYKARYRRLIFKHGLDVEKAFVINHRWLMDQIRKAQEARKLASVVAEPLPTAAPAAVGFPLGVGFGPGSGFTPGSGFGRRFGGSRFGGEEDESDSWGQSGRTKPSVYRAGKRSDSGDAFFGSGPLHRQQTLAVVPAAPEEKSYSLPPSAPPMPADAVHGAVGERVAEVDYGLYTPGEEDPAVEGVSTPVVEKPASYITEITIPRPLSYVLEPVTHEPRHSQEELVILAQSYVNVPLRPSSSDSRVRVAPTQVEEPLPSPPITPRVRVTPTQVEEPLPSPPITPRVRVTPPQVEEPLPSPPITPRVGVTPPEVDEPLPSPPITPRVRVTPPEVEEPLPSPPITSRVGVTPTQVKERFPSPPPSWAGSDVEDPRPSPPPSAWRGKVASPVCVSSRRVRVPVAAAQIEKSRRVSAPVHGESSKVAACGAQKLSFLEELTERVALHARKREAALATVVEEPETASLIGPSERPFGTPPVPMNAEERAFLDEKLNAVLKKLVKARAEAAASEDLSDQEDLETYAAAQVRRFREKIRYHEERIREAAGEKPTVSRSYRRPALPTTVELVAKASAVESLITAAESAAAVKAADPSSVPPDAAAETYTSSMVLQLKPTPGLSSPPQPPVVAEARVGRRSARRVVEEFNALSENSYARFVQDILARSLEFLARRRMMPPLV